MAITQAFCNTFKRDLLIGRHNLDTGGDSFKIALYLSAATLGASTAAYTATQEASGTGYTAGGNILTKNGVTGSTAATTAYCDFADETWTSSTITARGALIYNDTLTTPTADASCIVLNFGTDKSSSAGDFTVVFPTADTTNAIIRIA